MHPPPLHALRAFEAAARLGAFNRAAEELQVSPTAISHHIRALEADLGQPLFHRVARGVSLTAPGHALAEACTSAFTGLRQAVDAARVKAPARPVLTLALGPVLAARWLSPKLSALFEEFSDVELRLIPVAHGAAADAHSADLQILWGDGRWPGLQAVPFLEMSVVPVAAPTLLRQTGTEDVATLIQSAPLLHYKTDAEWEDWLRSAGMAQAKPRAGIRIDDANVLLKSCLEGQGVALGWLPLLAPELAEGRLVRLSPHLIASPNAYFLCLAERSRTNPTAMALMHWLLDRKQA
ncbi:MAG: LysR substrate-binding domain-containing protein [Pseudomonadota bacterium]